MTDFTPPLWNLAKLQARVAAGVLRDDLAAISNNYADYINEALREFQDKRSFVCMRGDASLTILSGQASVALPWDFKELQNKSEGSPVNLMANDPSYPGLMAPVQVNFEDAEIRRSWATAGALAPLYAGFHVFLKLGTFNGIGGIIGIEVPAFEDMTFRVSYNRFLPALVNATDHNHITDHWPTMIIAKAKSLALADVNDPIAATLESFSEVKFKQASFEDSRADLVGRVLHM